METFTTQDLIDELQQYHEPLHDRQEGGFTHLEYANAFNCDVKTARKRCLELVKNGTHWREKCHLGPHSVGWVYYKSE